MDQNEFKLQSYKYIIIVILKVFFEEQGIEFEKALSDEELAAIANGKESKNDIDIVARPDGSKVLEVTMSMGTTKTTMSLELYDYTYK